MALAQLTNRIAESEQTVLRVVAERIAASEQRMMAGLSEMLASNQRLERLLAELDAKA